MGIYIPPRVKRDQFNRIVTGRKTPEDFKHLIGMKVNDILLFDVSTDADLEAGKTILPRHFYIFIGNRDGELQFKPYEYDQYRIVVTTIQGVIITIDSIG